MNYWLLKANQRYNAPFSEWIVPKGDSTWYAKRTPKTFAKGINRNLEVGYWIACDSFEESRHFFLKKDKEGRKKFQVLYSTGILK